MSRVPRRVARRFRRGDGRATPPVLPGTVPLVGEDRRRGAVDKVTAMQFDRHGNRIWHDARALLDDEHTRYAVGSVAVPYGTSTRPPTAAGARAAPAPAPDGPAPSRPTSPPAGTTARSGSAAPAATTSAPTCPTSPT